MWIILKDLDRLTYGNFGEAIGLYNVGGVMSFSVLVHRLLLLLKPHFDTLVLHPRSSSPSSPRPGHGLPVENRIKRLEW